MPLIRTMKNIYLEIFLFLRYRILMLYVEYQSKVRHYLPEDDRQRKKLYFLDNARLSTCLRQAVA